MISVSWLKKRQPYWTRLETLLAIVKEHGLPALGRDELRELGLLYRQTATDLSAVRGDSSSVQQSRYLNQLLGRTHNIIYSGQKKTLTGIVQFFWNEYPINFSPVPRLHTDRSRHFRPWCTGWAVCHPVQSRLHEGIPWPSHGEHDRKA